MATNKLTAEQVQILREHIAANPDQTPQDIAGYFERVSDTDYDTTLTIASVATYIINGEEENLAGFVEDQGAGS